MGKQYKMFINFLESLLDMGLISTSFLGYQGYIFDYFEDDDRFVSNAIYSSVQHNHKIQTSGDKWDMAFTISGQYNDWLYLGANMNISGIEYRQISSTRESGYDSNSPMREIYFQNDLTPMVVASPTIWCHCHAKQKLSIGSQL